MAMIYFFLVAMIYNSTAFSQDGLNPGDLAGNGGDIVICGEGDGTKKDEVSGGVYALDYLQARNPLSWYTPVSSLEESLDRIVKILQYFPPRFQKSFQEFRSNLNNTKRFQGRRSWIRNDAELGNIRDESLVWHLPSNCIFKNDEDNKNDPRGIYQAIVRIELSEFHVVYEANVNLLKLLKEYLLQHSILLVHEWLRDFLPESYSLYRASVILHSQSADVDAESGELKKILENLNLKFP